MKRNAKVGIPVKLKQQTLREAEVNINKETLIQEFCFGAIRIWNI